MEYKTTDPSDTLKAEQDTTQETINTNSHEPATEPFLRRYPLVILITVTTLLLVAAGSYYYLSVSMNEPGFSTGSTDVEALLNRESVGDGPVATVNGEAIPRHEFENRVRELANATAQQGFDISSTSVASQIRQQTVTVLVNTYLLVQAAEAAGIEASDTTINEQYQTVLENVGGEEVLLHTLQDMEMTEADLRKDIREQLIIDALLLQETNLNDVSISDEEVAEYYETVNANNPDLPALEEIEVQISNQLLQQKRQQVVSDYIQTLRAEAEVEILI